MNEISIAQLQQALRNAERTVDTSVAPVVRRTAERVKQTQQENVPVRSGKTKRSIQATGPGGRPFTKNTVDAEIGPTWFVGKMIETGTVNMAPRVFVANSVEPHLQQHAREVADAVSSGALRQLTK